MGDLSEAGSAKPRSPSLESLPSFSTGCGSTAHVIRSMKENTRQGFWNGATAPLGYKLIEAEERGTKIKKKLDLDPVEVETVRLIYKLYLPGNCLTSSKGIAALQGARRASQNGYVS
jgi:hypothetical protein